MTMSKRKMSTMEWHVSNNEKNRQFRLQSFLNLALRTHSIGAYVLFAISPLRKIFMTLQLNKSL